MEEYKAEYLILCACGCGKSIGKPFYRLNGKTIVKRFIHGHNPHSYRFPKGHDIGHRFKKGENAGNKHAMWKGGRIIDKGGYVLVHSPNHPQCNAKGYVREHRLVMEVYLGRYLTLIEVVHHKNGIKTDNRIENLILCTNQSEHVALDPPKRK